MRLVASNGRIILAILLLVQRCCDAMQELQKQQTQQPYNCPKECICLSSTQVLCNGGGLSQIPDDLPPYVEHLSLIKNNIRQLKTDAFQRYKTLRKLYLDGNAINQVQAFAFRGLGRLQELSMQNTPLDRLGQFTFSGLHNLSHLYLANNQIRRIESYAFAGTSSIRLLVLTNNPTVRIDSSAFAGLSDVQMIYLPAGVRHLEQDAFNGLSMIGHLKLAHLDLQSLNSFVFRGLRHVQLLSIQESDLGVIRPGVFTNMSNIGRLSLTNNKIDAIESFELTADNRVRQFHFIGNHVLDLPHGRAIHIQGVPIVNASNNHFPCDCHIVSWMKSAMFANQSRERMMANNYCISPYEVHGKSIQSAAEEAHLFGGCADDDPPERTVALETTKPSTLFSSSSCSSMNGQSMTILIALYLLFQQFVQL
ncbi:hypothetical protein OUZ56_014913 [Daphnia magna]|uniref:LRRNT domain-containing protein n=1 Tax=Daphnia magna TaxID=35525 RepID=A0ABR0AL78_9CRUS|nr:hypothetical protein OUZ56_014913 [Daphnia magna]